MRFLLHALALLLTAFAARAAEPDATPFPTPPSKKGLQVQMIDDALALGIKHASLNVDLTKLPPTPEDVRFTAKDGKEYAFHAGRVKALDAQVAQLAKAGVV